MIIDHNTNYSLSNIMLILYYLMKNLLIRVDPSTSSHELKKYNTKFVETCNSYKCMMVEGNQICFTYLSSL